MQFKSFRRNVVAALRRLGAIEEKLGEDFTLETQVGDLRVVPGNGTVRCRFTEPELARTKVLCNPHSGLFNLLPKPDETQHEFVAEVERTLLYLKGDHS